MNPLDDLDMLLDTLESVDEDYAGLHAAFALRIIDDSNPASAAVAATYLKWALTKRDIAIDGFTSKCRCDDGWLENADGVYPCARCRPEPNSKWFAEFVDSGKEPHGKAETVVQQYVDVQAVPLALEV